MAEITAAVVKELRERTGSGMMDCKKALAETGGDMEKAIDYLREKGLAKAAKKAERTASDGRIFHCVSEDGKLGVLLELNSETDFVAKTDEFNELGHAIVEEIAGKNPADVNALSDEIKAQVTATIAKLGENIVVKRFARYAADPQGGLPAGGSRVFHYVHNNFKVGVLLELAPASDDAEFGELGHAVCMQIAAMNPGYIKREDVPEEVLDRERAVYRQQLLDEGKPADRLDKIIEGKLRKYFETACLIEQEYIRDGDKRVKDLLGKSVTVKRFARFSIGE
ncbi:MAG: elongation factor Ts [Fretibacterium sp.]|nr:elongation factor Ts [Fretibacterium sp.]